MNGEAEMAPVKAVQSAKEKLESSEAQKERQQYV
jgi:hypothetical protein